MKFSFPRTPLALACFFYMHAAIASHSKESASTPQESLSLRRIAAFWKEGEDKSAQVHILDFLSKYPTSSFADHLHAMLGDLYFKESRYQEALENYGKIQKEELQQKTLLPRMQCHFELKNYSIVADTARVCFKDRSSFSKERLLHIRFLFAEALFREALLSSNKEVQLPLFKEAKNHYLLLSRTSYRDAALFPLAKIHQSLGEAKEAAPFYLHLAQKYPEQKEELLFQAASLQVGFDPQSAIQTFEESFRLKGKKAKEAAFNALTLLFEQGKHTDFLRFYEESQADLPKEKLSLIEFYKGKSFYALGEHSKAVASLEAFAYGNDPLPSEKKNALLTLIACARRLNDRALFDRHLKKLLTSFPKDPHCANALLVHAQLCAERGDLSHSLKDLEMLLSDFPAYEKRDDALYDYALLQIREENWAEARKTLLTFLKEFPENVKVRLGWRHLLNCSLKEVQGAPMEKREEKTQEIVALLKTLLAQQNVFNSEERRESRFLLIKTLYETKKYTDTLNELDAYVQDYPRHPSLADAHLLAAICHQNLSSVKDFIFHAEKTLSLNPDHSQKDSIHLQLYNAYLAQKEEDKVLDLAANHLFACYSSNPSLIKTENLLWLADHYYQEAKGNPSGIEAKRASLLLTALLGVGEGATSLHLCIGDRSLEPEVLKLADILPPSVQKTFLLEALVSEQKKTPERAWKFQEKALFELARSHEAEGTTQKAIECYSALIAASAPSSYFSKASLLQRARVQLGLLTKEQRREDALSMMEILNCLKDLQIKKRLESEPIHLEAAIEYVDIRVALAPADSQLDRSLLLWNHLKEDFLSQEEIFSQEYHTSRKHNPEKDLLFCNYMRYIDAEILRLEAIKSAQTGNVERATELSQKARLQFEELLEVPSSLPSFLKERIQKSREAMNTSHV